VCAPAPRFQWDNEAEECSGGVKSKIHVVLLKLKSRGCLAFLFVGTAISKASMIHDSLVCG